MCTLNNKKSTQSPLFKKEKNSVCTFQNIERSSQSVLFKKKKKKLGEDEARVASDHDHPILYLVLRAICTVY